MKLSQINGWKENSPVKQKCPIHNEIRQRPDIGGCSCYYVATVNEPIDAISSLSISVDKEYLEKYFLRRGLSEMMVSLFTVEIAANAEKFLRITKE